MLLPLLIAAVLIGFWAFNITLPTNQRKAVKLVNRHSLWSLMLFLFFPSASKPFEPRELG